MSEQSSSYSYGIGREASLALDSLARRAVLRRGMGADLPRGAAAGSARAGASPRNDSNRVSWLGSRRNGGPGRAGGSPGWYRWVAVGASGAGTVAVVVIAIVNRGVLQ